MAIVTGLFAAWFKGKDAKSTPPNAAHEQVMDELRAQVASLQARVAFAEARISSASRIDANQTPQPARSAEPASPPNGREGDRAAQRSVTREERARQFATYFDTLDAMRGQREDTTLSVAYGNALRDVNPAFQTLKSAKVNLVGCGNGLCRVEAAFDDANLLAMGRTELLNQIGPLASLTTAFLDRDKKVVTAYFAAPGTKLPPFPASPN